MSALSSISNWQSAIGISPERFHDLLERLPGRPGAFERQAGQWFVHHLELVEEVVALRFDVNDAGRVLAFARALRQVREGSNLVRRVVAFAQLAEHQLRA